MRISDWSSDVCSSDLGYSDWLRQGPSRIPQGQTSREQTATTQAEVAPKPAAEAAAAAAPAKDKRKLGFKQARELEQLPARIEALEMRIAELTAAMNDPAFYQRSEEHTSELQSLMRISYADFCLKKKKTTQKTKKTNK